MIARSTIGAEKRAQERCDVRLQGTPECPICGDFMSRYSKEVCNRCITKGWFVPEQAFLYNLALLMRQRHLTQRQVAKGTGISEDTISGYKHVRFKAPRRRIKIIADMFKITPKELIGGYCE